MNYKVTREQQFKNMSLEERELYSLGGRTIADLQIDEMHRYFVYMADGNFGLYKYYL